MIRQLETQPLYGFVTVREYTDGKARGIDQGLIQRYRAAYRAALSDSELNAALAFLSSPEGRSFSEAGLAANREVLPLIGRRQESQASRAAALLQTRLASLLSDLSKEKSGAASSAQ